MSWNRIQGHDAAAAALALAWKRGRLGHAYLFVGPHGVGKQSFARELARTLLCERLTDKFEACRVCDSCMLVEAGTHPDLFQVRRPDDVLEFPIRVIKDELLPSLAMKPARGGRKVAIVDDADDLNEEAANCFLKTLEEPPPKSVLILIGGQHAERQLPTILSRCQLIRFSPLPPAAVTQILTDAGITDRVRQARLLQLAEGSPGQAIALDDDEVWAFRGKMIDTLRGDRLDPQLTASMWMEFIDNAGKEAAVHRQRASLIIRMLIVLLGSAVKIAVGASVVGMEPAEEQSLRKLADRLGEEKLLVWIERALEADLQIDRRVQLILIIEAFLDACCRYE
ncbi:MAG: DNA polymerase III subunit delta' [Planctomycetes bacterium]|nr:DNA polymerase III subunit delta' [Planctomycetota bacterium]